MEVSPHETVGSLQGTVCTVFGVPSEEALFYRLAGDNGMLNDRTEALSGIDLSAGGTLELRRYASTPSGVLTQTHINMVVALEEALHDRSADSERRILASIIPLREASSSETFCQEFFDALSSCEPPLLPMLVGLLEADVKQTILSEALWLLANLLAGTECSVKAAVEAGCIPPLLSLCLEPGVADSAIHALGNIAAEETFVGILVESGAIPIVVNMLGGVGTEHAADFIVSVLQSPKEVWIDDVDVIVKGLLDASRPYQEYQTQTSLQALTMVLQAGCGAQHLTVPFFEHIFAQGVHSVELVLLQAASSAGLLATMVEAGLVGYVVMAQRTADLDEEDFVPVCLLTRYVRWRFFLGEKLWMGCEII